MQTRALIVIVDPETSHLIRQRPKLESRMEALTLTRRVRRQPSHLWAEKFSALSCWTSACLPRMGIELARRVRSSGINQQTPIVMPLAMTKIQGRAVSEGFEAGANFFMYKPI